MEKVWDHTHASRNSQGHRQRPRKPWSPHVSDGKGAKGERKPVVPFLAHTSGARAKLESEQFVPEEGVTTAVVIGVVGGAQCFLELSYPLTHLGDLTVKFLRVSENEPEDCSAKQGYGEGCYWDPPRAMASTRGT